VEDSEGAFFCVQPNVEPPEVVEGVFQIEDDASALSGFYYDGVDVDLEVMPYLVLE
jgi:hypothetical protein